jgi:hypothetical protein
MISLISQDIPPCWDVCISFKDIERYLFLGYVNYLYGIKALQNQPAPGWASAWRGAALEWTSNWISRASDVLSHLQALHDLITGHMLHPYLKRTEIQNTAAITVNQTLRQPILNLSQVIRVHTYPKHYPNISSWHLPYLLLPLHSYPIYLILMERYSDMWKILMETVKNYKENCKGL